MITRENKLLFFISCITDNEEIKKLKDDKKVLSIYHVCGVDPWLIICKSESIEDLISLNCDYQLNLKYISITPFPCESKRVPQEINKIIFWIFIKGICEKEFKTFIDEADGIKDYDITEKYKIFGEYNFIIKLYTSNINGVDDFLRRCRDKGITTSTKCVLSIIKENGEINVFDVVSKRKDAQIIKRELKYAMARIIANTRDFIRKSPDEQIRFLKTQLQDMMIPFADEGIKNNILNIDTTKKSEYSRDDLKHPNELIERYSIKLNRDKWLKTLLFFKAAPGKKDKLEDSLKNTLLGVTTSQFSRKLYHITGDYDFLVPFDCKELKHLTEAIDNYLKKNGELITSFINTVCRPPEGEGEGILLDSLDTHFIEALLINATQITDFEKNIRAKDIFSPILEETELILAEEKIAPREDYVRDKIKLFDKDSIRAYLNRFTSFDNIGVETTIEFKDDALIQTLARFYFTDHDLKNKFLAEISNKIRRCEIIATVYEPVRDPLTVMCLLMVKRLIEIETLFYDLEQEKYCRKMEFHIIFHQGYYSKTIEQYIRCKPCFYPLVYKKEDKDCKRKCYDCSNKKKEEKECIIQNCGNCIRYILPRKRNRILDISFPFEKELKQKIKISLVGIDTNLSKFLLLEELIDQEGLRIKIFENYRNIYVENKGIPEYFYENPDNVSTEYNNVVDRDNYRKRYNDAVIKVLEHILNLEPDIIIFPEYTIPLQVYKEISRCNIRRECVIVGGSHIDEYRFNVCPIIFNTATGEKEIYHYYKNNFSPFEEKLGLLNNRGTAYLRFLNTKWGHLYIQVCYDVHRTARSEEFKKVDILLVPSFNPSSEFKESIESIAKTFVLVAGYSNTINQIGKIKSNFFVPSGKAARIDLEQLHSPSCSGRAGDTKNNIFDITPPACEFAKVEENEFNFKLKHIVLDICELDKLRTYKTRKRN